MERGWEAAMQQLVASYFSGKNSTFSETQFRHHFRMDRVLFFRIIDELTAHNIFFNRRQMLLESLVLHHYRRQLPQFDFWLTDVVPTKLMSGFVLENQQLQNV